MRWNCNNHSEKNLTVSILVKIHIAIQGVWETLLTAEIRMNAGLFNAPYNGSQQASGDIGSIGNLLGT